MICKEKVPLRELTTLRTGGEARYVIDVASVEELQEAFRFAKEKNLPWYVLGDGSNVLAPDEGYTGVVIRIVIPGASFENDGKNVRLTAGSGVSWEALVDMAAAEHAWGIENLAGIPGTAGAAPIQNIGAYGREIKDTLLEVEAYDTKTDEVIALLKDACEFSYRDSLFKRNGALIVTRIVLSLEKDARPDISYPDLQRAQEAGESLTTPRDVAQTVRRIRSLKFPDLSVTGTAGSFFKNPIVSEEVFRSLQDKLPGIPGFPHEGRIKVPLAYILDRGLSLKGHCIGKASLYEAQPLVLVLHEGGTAHDVEALAHDVEERVRAFTGVSIEREVRSMR